MREIGERQVLVMRQTNMIGRSGLSERTAARSQEVPDLSNDPMVVYLQLSIGSKRLLDAAAKNLGVLQNEEFKFLLVATTASRAIAREDAFPSESRLGGSI